MYIYAFVYVCVSTHFCLYKSYLFNCLSCRYLGCYLFPQIGSFNNELNSMRIKHVNKLIITHLNINSLRNKFEFLIEFV